MRSFNELLLRVLPLLCYAASRVSGSVFHATEEDFDGAVLQPGSSWFVEFFAPWCGHCKAFEPVYLNASEDSRLQGKVNFAAVDITAHKPLAERYNVTRFPTVLFLEDGIVYEYNGRRNEEDMIAYGLAMNKDPLIPLLPQMESSLRLSLGMTYVVVTPPMKQQQNRVLHAIMKQGMRPVRPWITAFTTDITSLQKSDALQKVFDLNQQVFDEFDQRSKADGSAVMLLARSQFDEQSAVSVIGVPSPISSEEDAKAAQKAVDEISSFFTHRQFGSLTRIKSSPMDQRSGVLKSSVFRQSKLVGLLVLDTDMPENSDLLSSLSDLNTREHELVNLVGGLSAKHPEWRTLVPSSDAGREGGDSGSSSQPELLHRCTFAVIGFDDFHEYLSERFGIEVNPEGSESTSNTDEQLSLPIVLFYDTDLQAYYTVDYRGDKSAMEKTMKAMVNGEMNNDLTYVNSFIVRKVMALEQWLNGMKPWQMVVFFIGVFVSIFALMVSVDYCCATEQQHYRRPPIKDD